MSNIKLLLFALILLFSRNATGEESIKIASNECYSKGGMGIIVEEIYVVTNSRRNEIRLPSNKVWRGSSTSKAKVVYIVNDVVIENPASISEFDLSKAILISFQKDRIYFYNFQESFGGFYRR